MQEKFPRNRRKLQKTKTKQKPVAKFKILKEAQENKVNSKNNKNI